VLARPRPHPGRPSPRTSRPSTCRRSSVFAKNIVIPPFFILHIAGRSNTLAQARRLANVLGAAGIPVTLVAGRETTHASINDNIGAPDDPVAAELFAFVAEALRR
jgi:acetyl esterase/lipase